MSLFPASRAVVIGLPVSFDFLAELAAATTIRLGTGRVAELDFAFRFALTTLRVPHPAFGPQGALSRMSVRRSCEATKAAELRS